MNESNGTREPEVIPYAAASPDQRKKLQPSPRDLLRGSWWLIGVSAAAGLVVVLGGDLLFFLAALSAWVPATLALFLACVAAWRALACVADPAARPPRQRLYIALLLSALLFVGHLGSCSLLSWRFRDMDRSAVARANLAGIGTALRSYANEYGAYPPSLQQLLDAEMCMPKNLFSPADPAAGLGPPGYTSYTYQSPPTNAVGTDKGVVIAFERAPWNTHEFRLCPKWGRWVLFGDGSVKLLDAAQFEEAMRQDAQRRDGLTSTMPQTQPVTRRTTPSVASQRSH